jgi:hypothetical protein
MIEYASAAIPVPEEIIRRFPNKETKWIEGINYTREKSEKEKRQEEAAHRAANRARSYQLDLRRRAEAEREQVQIPLPSYGQGATRRSRFAFGRITQQQARRNTALQLRTETNENLLNPEEPPEEVDNEPPQVAEEELFEEDFFQEDELPSKDDCA